MTRLLLACSLILLLASALHATPIRTLEHATALQRDPGPHRDDCYLQYYNYCSGWVWYWSGYCYSTFYDAPTLPQFGTCFDLADCPADCRHLTDVWWAWKWYGPWHAIDIEIFCADQYSCPIGPPLAAYYDVYLGYSYPWARFSFGGLELCPCDEAGTGKFVVLFTYVRGYEDLLPYSDINSYNIDAGCETEWRCSGHSFVYRNVVPYCDVYGMPGPMWVSGPTYGCTGAPLIPPGCHNYYSDTGFYTEFLIDCYVSCQGATQTQNDSWSQMKKLYR